MTILQRELRLCALRWLTRWQSALAESLWTDPDLALLDDLRQRTPPASEEEAS